MIPAVNLVPERRAAARRNTRRKRRWVCACAAYAAVLALVLALVGGGSVDGGRSSEVEMVEVRARIDRTNADLAEVESELSRARATLAANRTVGDQPNFSALLRLIAGTLDEQTVLTSFGLDPAQAGGSAGPSDSYALSLSGMGRSHAAVSALVLRLEKIGLFDRVQMLDTRKESYGSQNAISFRVSCAIGDAPDAAGAVAEVSP